MIWQDAFRFAPWRDLERLHQEVNRLFTDYSRPVRSQEYPMLNIWTSEDEALVTADLPGIDAKDLELSVVGSTLTLRGRRARADLKQGETYHRQERRHGEFVRSVDLPFNVDAEKVGASYARGQLTIRVPRAESDRPRKIAIQAS